MKYPLLTLCISAAVTLTGCNNQSTIPPQHENDAITRYQDVDKRLGQGAAEPAHPTYKSKPMVLTEELSAALPVQSVEAERSLVGSQRPAAAPAPITETSQMKRSDTVASLSHSYIQPEIPIVDRENYLAYEENGLQLTAKQPVSTFSIDVDTAGYSNIRRMLIQEGRLPPRDAVKIEELVNYFSYDYPKAESLETPFSVSTEVAPAPWDQNKLLLQIGLAGYQPALDDRPGANLVFLVDVSGSMRDQNKLGLVKRSLNLLLGQLTATDRVALVVYAGAAGIVLDSTPASQRALIRQAINRLNAGGSTNGSAGIRLAYQIAEDNFIAGGINRVIIASDGDMNVGTVNLEALKDLVGRKRASGVSLTTLGYGAGNYNYALMEQLADVGDGNAAYIDNIREAQKVLVDELQSTLLTIAKDVKIQVEFNPALVSAYRLLGYENRMLRREDFRNDRVDAGEIGAGHTVTALYELSLAGTENQLMPPLRYVQPVNPEPERSGSMESEQIINELAYVRLRFKQPESNSGIELEQAVGAAGIPRSIDGASNNLRFASAVAGFGQLLRGSPHSGNWNLDQIVALAASARGIDKFGYRGEFINMARLSKNYLPKRAEYAGTKAWVNQSGNL